MSVVEVCWCNKFKPNVNSWWNSQWKSKGGGTPCHGGRRENIARCKGNLSTSSSAEAILEQLSSGYIMFRVTRARFNPTMSTWSALAVVKSTKVSELEMNWPFIQNLLAWTSACGFCFLSYRSLVALNCGMNLLLLHNHLQENIGKLLTCSNFAHFMDGRVKSSVLIICERGHYFIAP